MLHDLMTDAVVFGCYVSFRTDEPRIFRNFVDSFDVSLEVGWRVPVIFFFFVIFFRLLLRVHEYIRCVLSRGQ